MRDYHKKEKYEEEKSGILIALCGVALVLFLMALLDWWLKVPS